MYASLPSRTSDVMASYFVVSNSAHLQILLLRPLIPIVKYRFTRRVRLAEGGFIVKLSTL